MCNFKFILKRQFLHFIWKRPKEGKTPKHKNTVQYGLCLGMFLMLAQDKLGIEILNTKLIMGQISVQINIRLPRDNQVF